MLKVAQSDLVRSTGSKLGRILLGLLFVVSGLQLLLQGLPNVAGYFATYGIPLPFLVALAVIALKIVAGGLIIIGKKFVTISAAALIVFTLIATVIAHMNWSDPMQLTAALKNLAIVGGLLYLMAYGPGGTNLPR